MRWPLSPYRRWSARLRSRSGVALHLRPPSGNPPGCSSTSASCKGPNCYEFCQGERRPATFLRISFGLGWVREREDRALQECNLSARSSVDCGPIRPGLGFAPGSGSGDRTRKPRSKAINSSSPFGRQAAVLRRAPRVAKCGKGSPRRSPGGLATPAGRSLLLLLSVHGPAGTAPVDSSGRDQETGAPNLQSGSLPTPVWLRARAVSKTSFPSSCAPLGGADGIGLGNRWHHSVPTMTQPSCSGLIRPVRQRHRSTAS